MIRFRFIELFSNYTIYSKQSIDNEKSHTNLIKQNVVEGGKTNQFFFFIILVLR